MYCIGWTEYVQTRRNSISKRFDSFRETANAVCSICFYCAMAQLPEQQQQQQQQREPANKRVYLYA